jgi:hypothetical protein
MAAFLSYEDACNFSVRLLLEIATRQEVRAVGERLILSEYWNFSDDRVRAQIDDVLEKGQIFLAARATA